MKGAVNQRIDRALFPFIPTSYCFVDPVLLQDDPQQPFVSAFADVLSAFADGAEQPPHTEQHSRFAESALARQLPLALQHSFSQLISALQHGAPGLQHSAPGLQHSAFAMQQARSTVDDAVFA